ncbi:spore coat protein [Fictibacillus sp. KIGAM418]|uniref:Spore coat protein n=1 Tax=Fictibacillus marinisediminis TaxID=2878389 RepID=A0A9X1XCN7_9BACL|nr:CotD family spore coat protein [Fictibacillus marinisediminis]MCK6258261.1 spore coat protein [Fictibacillus marinisediminis]
MYYGYGCHHPRVVVHPTQCCVQQYYHTEEVIHVHPVQIQHVNHMLYQHVHEYPVSEYQTCQEHHQNISCGAPPCC